MDTKEYCNFKIVVGSDFTTCLTLKDPATGNPIDLTGDVWELDLFNSPKNRNSRNQFVRYTNDVGGTGITLDELNGKVIVALTAATTSLLEEEIGKVWYTIRRKQSGGANNVYIHGTLQIEG